MKNRKSLGKIIIGGVFALALFANINVHIARATEPPVVWPSSDMKKVSIKKTNIKPLMTEPPVVWPGSN